jgi:hypothetical protein
MMNGKYKDEFDMSILFACGLYCDEMLRLRNHPK